MSSDTCNSPVSSLFDSKQELEEDVLDSFFYQNFASPMKPANSRFYGECEDINEGSTMPQARKMKKREQIKVLENEFIKDRNWSKKKIIYLAKVLGLSEC